MIFHHVTFSTHRDVLRDSSLLEIITNTLKRYLSLVTSYCAASTERDQRREKQDHSEHQEVARTFRTTAEPRERKWP